MALILASESPRRRELFRLVAADFVCVSANVDESGVTAESPAGLAMALAALKAEACLAALAKGQGPGLRVSANAGEKPTDATGPVVVGCDTVVEFAGRAIGKPKNEAEARAVLRALRGMRHHVHTGVCLLGPGWREEFVEASAVDFSHIPDEEIEAYIQTAEPYDKAGGYGIQGWAARFIPRIEGCYYNVMGLPVASLYRVLHLHGAL